MHEDERLLPVERRAHLPLAVLAPEVAKREEEEDHLRAADVLLERPDAFEIVHLLESRKGCQRLGLYVGTLCCRRTSRKILMPGMSSCSCFLMTAAASCPVDLLDARGGGVRACN